MQFYRIFTYEIRQKRFMFFKLYKISSFTILLILEKRRRVFSIVKKIIRNIVNVRKNCCVRFSLDSEGWEVEDGGCASPRELPNKACTIDNSPSRCNVIKFFLLRELHPVSGGGVGPSCVICNPSIGEIGRERRGRGEEWSSVHTSLNTGFPS